jgi:Fe-S oxidoreductase
MFYIRGNFKMGLFGKINTVYVTDCTTYHKYKEMFDLYQKILNKLGIKFMTLGKHRCCGLPALEAGYEAGI